MAEKGFQGFQSFVKITVGDKEFTFISSWRAEPDREFTAPVYTISNSHYGAGYRQQQAVWNITVDIPLATKKSLFASIKDIDPNAESQMIVKGNKPSANAGDMTFEGTTFIFSKLVAKRQSFEASEGNVMSTTTDFFARSMITS